MTAASLLRFHAFTVGSNGFLIPSERMLDYVAQLETRTLSGFMGWMAKAELAGQDCPVIDLRRRFSLRWTRTVHAVETSPAIIVSWKLSRIVLAVDALNPRSIEINPTEIVTIPPIGDYPIMGIVAFAERQCYVLSLELLMMESQVITGLAFGRALLRSA